MNTFVNGQDKFILSSITDILEQVVSSSSCLDDNISAYPICDYMMQAVFLKMTGFLEQKFKAIRWSMATNDYAFRHKFISNKIRGTATYKDKGEIYTNLYRQVEVLDNSFLGFTEEERKEILIEVNAEFSSIFNKSILLSWEQRKYIDYKNIWSEVSYVSFASGNQIFTGMNNGKVNLQKVYEKIYGLRNRIAHNTLSYQQNLPTLDRLQDTEYKYENMFLFFSTLMVMDKIVSNLYLKYYSSLGCDF